MDEKEDFNVASRASGVSSLEESRGKKRVARMIPSAKWTSH